MEWLTQAVIGDFTKIRKRRLGYYGTEARFDGERVEKLSSAHGLPEAIDAGRVIAGFEPLKPLSDVLPLEHAVGGDPASARSVRPRVRHQDVVPVLDEDLRIARRAGAVVSHAVQKDNGIPAAMFMSNVPGAERRSIRRSDFDVVQAGPER